MEITPKVLLGAGVVTIAATIAALVGLCWHNNNVNDIKEPVQVPPAEEVLYEPYGSQLTCANNIYPNKNNDYYVVQRALVFGKDYQNIRYNDYIVFNNNDEHVHSFLACNRWYMHLNKVYLFKNKNIVIYFENSNNDDVFQINNMTLYDLDKKTTMTLPGKRIDISADENYIIGHSADNYSVIVHDVSHFPIIKTQYITREKKFWGDLKFCPDSKQFVAAFYDIEEHEQNEVRRLGLWKLSDLKWDEETEVPPCRLIIPAHHDYVGDLQFSENGKYLYCEYIKEESLNYFHCLINFETFQDIMFPDNRTFASYRLLQYTNLLIKDKSFEPLEIYELDDLSEPLYYDAQPLWSNNYHTSEALFAVVEEGPQCHIRERSPQYLVYRKNDGLSCLLQYDKEKKTIRVERDNIEGIIHDVRDDGYVLSSPENSKKIFVYPRIGDKIEFVSSDEQNNLRIFRTFSAIKDQVHVYGVSVHKVDIPSPGASARSFVRFCRPFDLHTKEMAALCNKSNDIKK